MNAILHSSTRMDWLTPPALLESVRLLSLDGSIGLDPCSASGDLVQARSRFRLPRRDGLKLSWLGYGLVFCNPPYGREVPLWTKKAADEFAAGLGNYRGDQCVLLVPARTDTDWFHRWCFTADGLCFWKGRLTFVGATHPAPFPSSLIYHGDHPDRFEEIFRKLGQVVIP